MLELEGLVELRFNTLLAMWLKGQKKSSDPSSCLTESSQHFMIMKAEEKRSLNKKKPVILLGNV